MLELNQLEQLVTIAQAGTISKAAEILLISQPALTRSIQRLEEELGVQLFNRKKNKVTLNDNGQLAVQYAKKILNEANQMAKHIQDYDKSKHTISIGSLAPAPIWALTTIFKKIYPEMTLSSDLITQEETLLSGLNHDQYSIIILSHPVSDTNLISQSLFEESLYLSVPPAHPLAMAKQITFDDLNGESVLLLSRIGFWNEVCLNKIPDSHLLIQEDLSVFNELTKASALPYFRSNITMQSNKENNRVYIPICDKQASVTYYAIYKKKEKKKFACIKDEITTIDWSKV